MKKVLTIKKINGKEVVITSKKNEINSNYDFIMPFSDKLVEKYYKINGRAENFYMLNAVEAQKTYLTDNEIEEISKKHNMVENYRRYFIRWCK